MCSRFLISFGDATSQEAWSGIPYYFSKAARAKNWIERPLDLTVPGYQLRRTMWQLKEVACFRRPFGYQYSTGFMSLMATQLRTKIPPNSDIISHFQLLPFDSYTTTLNLRHSFYCDATLTQLHSSNGLSSHLSNQRIKDIVARERECYLSAFLFVAMSKATAEHVVSAYGVPRRNVAVIRPGVNLSEEYVRAFLARRGASWRRSNEPFSSARPAILGFVGMDWRRKGLHRLIDIASELDRRGRAVRVRVIGRCPAHIARHHLVDYVGVLSKRADEGRFLHELDKCAMVCLLSSFEPLGISTLEALSLGIPVLGTRVGGIPECVPSDGGVLCGVSDSRESVADVLEQQLFDPNRYGRMVQGAVAASGDVFWSSAVSKFQELWVTREAYC